MNWITKHQAAKILNVRPDHIVQSSQRNAHIQVRRKRGVPGNRSGQRWQWLYSDVDIERWSELKARGKQEGPRKSVRDVIIHRPWNAVGLKELRI